MWYNSNMKNLFNKYGIEINDVQLELFDKYYRLLIEYNEKFNITAITEKEEVYVKHFIDSIVDCGKLNSGTLIDVGSGGGFPAIPVKIMNPNLQVTMLEATGKKCEFLNTVIKELQLKNIKVINNRAEELAFDKDHRESYDFCTARAVARLNILCEYCMPFVKVNGTFVSYKGDAGEEVNEALSSIKTLGGCLESVNNYTINDAKRALVYIKKISKTDLKYPRANGKIRKKPL